jgi:hypothetical protein
MGALAIRWGWSLYATCCDDLATTRQGRLRVGCPWQRCASRLTLPGNYGGGFNHFEPLDFLPGLGRPAEDATDAPADLARLTVRRLVRAEAHRPMPPMEALAVAVAAAVLLVTEDRVVLADDLAGALSVDHAEQASG